MLFIRQGLHCLAPAGWSLLGWGGRVQEFLLLMLWPGKYFLRCLTSHTSFELTWHQWWDWTFRGQPCSYPLLWLVSFLPSVYFTLLCRKWLHRSATITLTLSRKEIYLKLGSCFFWCYRGLWHFFVIAGKKWLICSYHSQTAQLFFTSQSYCLLFSLSLYLVWHFKKPPLMTACSINCVA